MSIDMLIKGIMTDEIKTGACL
ncbi:BnaA04g14910D [Brassica napus]|uniref:BnaA04g14910D protein n=1 Tax=Brassica napus TaxID=3708 RepID=A0A078HC68_BRANA|nr:BnaA04g14910D [Brassica napus]